MRGWTVAAGAALLLLAGGLGVQGQEEGDPAPAERAGRVPFEREQGAREELKAIVEELVAALRVSDVEHAGEVLRSFRPDVKAIKDAFTEAGERALGKRLLQAASRLFSGEPAEIARRLALDPELTEVEVYEATTEDLLSMEHGTVAARHFASGLRSTARLLEPRYRWYAVALRRPDDDGAVHLQIFFHHEGRYVLLGRIWRLEQQQ